MGFAIMSEGRPPVIVEYRAENFRAEELCLKSPKPFLDTVSTGSGSDLVGDQHAIFPNILDSIV